MSETAPAAGVPLPLRWASARLGRRCLLHEPTGATLGWVCGSRGGWRAVSPLGGGLLDGPHGTREEACGRLFAHVLAAMPPGTVPAPPWRSRAPGRYALPDW